MTVPTRVLILSAIMIGLYGVDKYLAAQEHLELQQEARNHYTHGQQLLQAGKPREAVADFARARSLERGNREYQLALATAQVADRQTVAATDTLTQFLTEDSNDGRANLLMARVLAGGERFQDADAYYHRAIYGVWPSGSQTEPQKVRLELANMLAVHGGKQELLSELLLLQHVSPQEAATEKQVAQLFLQAGSAQRAAEAYTQLIHENPADIDARLGLAQAEVLAGNYRAAENAVMNALRLRPYSESIQSQLRMVVRLASLDPTSRRLSTKEKYRRSVEILDLVRRTCNSTPQPAGQPASPITNEQAEAILDQAESLWKQDCSSPPGPDNPLTVLMNKLAIQ